MRKQIDLFQKDLDELILKYADQDVTNGEIISALEVAKFDFMMGLQELSDGE